ncbi:phosphate signaling complex protein PhoU [Tepidiphilus succinatimandens]|jgi:phosphate transport system protein|uniref:phosphate signaling complex protein PhoU n=1 Tax=Tepidiphilus succinatimandens TaxID=224436 RepID=UPI00197E0AE4|nr:phosphate signaling complex protein PhoU [Tepidiphilus succinatimandens]
MKTMEEHTFRPYDRELNQLRQTVLEMGRAVERQVEKAVEGVRKGDQALFDEVLQTERSINEEDRRVFEQSVQLIVRNAPAAADLRLVMSSLQISKDLERIGDEAKKIAKSGIRLYQAAPAFTPAIELELITRTTLAMLHASLDAYARLDDSQAQEILADDRTVDAMFKGILRELITYMMEDPRTISHSLELVFVAKSLERVGDHAKNVIEQVVYLVEGRDIRYTPEAKPQPPQ